MIRLRRSFAFSFLERYAAMLINMIMLAIVARLLTPAEVGVFMVACAVAMLIDCLREFGAGAYLIQTKELTREGVRTVVTVSAILSAVLAGVLALGSGLVAAFYEEPGLAAAIQVLALGFLASPVSSTVIALLRRDLCFGMGAAISLAGLAINFASFCALALAGHGYMSLAWASLAGSIGSALLAVAIRPQLWMFRPALAEWRQVLSFGGYASATAMLNILYQMFPQLLLGRVLSFDAVGLYSRATTICALPDRFLMSALQPVILPALSAQVRQGLDLKQPYLWALGMVTAVLWPFLLCLALLADPVVRLLLGPDWSGAAPLVRLLALASTAMFPAFLTYPMLVAVGRVKDTLTASLISLPPSFLIIAAAAQVGIEAVAASMFVTAPLQVYVALRFIRLRVPFRWVEMITATRKSMVVALASAAAPAAAVGMSGFSFDVSVPVMLVAGAGAGIGWLAGLWLTRHPLLAEVRRSARWTTDTFARLRTPKALQET